MDRFLEILHNNATWEAVFPSFVFVLNCKSTYPVSISGIPLTSQSMTLERLFMTLSFRHLPTIFIKKMTQLQFPLKLMINKVLLHVYFKLREIFS